jgi:hypothetical protein
MAGRGVEGIMKVEHLALDGAVVSIEADADVTTPATATGWAIVPSLMQAHPFSIYPAGHSTLVEQAMRASFPELEILSVENYTMKEGTLRVAEVQRPAATGGTTRLTIAAWEGPGGCLHTSLWGAEGPRLVEMFETLQFSASARGLAIDSPVVAQPRAPEVVKELPGIGVLSIRPAVANELERVPKTRGYSVDHGELFRVRDEGLGLLFVSDSTVVMVTPLPSSDPDQMLQIAQRWRVEWSARRRVGAR